MGHEFLGGAFDFSVLKIFFAIQILFHMKNNKFFFTFPMICYQFLRNFSTLDFPSIFFKFQISSFLGGAKSFSKPGGNFLFRWGTTFQVGP